MKIKIKLFIFPILTIALILILAITFQNRNKTAVRAEGENGVIYADYFTENEAGDEWVTGWNATVLAPEVENDSLHLSGSGAKPCAAMLGIELPSKFDMYFSIDMKERGGDEQDSGVFFCIGGDYGQHYQILFSENKIRIKYNGTTDVAIKNVEGLTGGDAHGFHFKVDGPKMEVYLDGADEACLTFTAYGDFLTFEQARTFGVFSYAKDVYFDNLVISNGSDFIPVSEIAIQGENRSQEIAGLGNSLQMQMFVQPSNATDRALVWSVNNEELAEISQDGLLTAKGYGSVIVSAYTRDGSGLVATKKIHVGTGEQENSVISTNRKTVLTEDYNIVCDGENGSVDVLDNGRILVVSSNCVNYSDDGGETWTEGLKGSFESGSIFEQDKKVYLMTSDGETKDLVLYVSENNGESWSDKYVLDERDWHTSPSEVLKQGECIYLTMEVESATAINKGYTGSAALSPILMRAKCNSDLTKTESWTFSSELSYADLMNGKTAGKVDYVDVPNNYGDGKETGWAAGNLFQIYDEQQMWYDSSMSSFFLYLHGNEGTQGYALLLKIKENANGSMTPTLVTTVTGEKKLLFVPMPGGNQEFSIIYDENSGLYWQVSNYLNEDNRVALYFSKNAYDWSFAGIVAKIENGICMFPSIAIDGDDLIMVTEQSDGVAFYRIEDFRSLVY